MTNRAYFLVVATALAAAFVARRVVLRPEDPDTVLAERADARAAEPPSLAVEDGVAATAPAPGTAADEVPLADGVRDVVVVAVVADGRTGSPVADARVGVRLEAPERVAFAALEARTDASGTARLGPFPVPRVPRRLRSAVSLVVVDLDREAHVDEDDGLFVRRAPRFGYRALEERVPADAGPLELRADLRRESGVPVAGRVVDASGGGIEHVHVRVVRQGDEREWTVTNEDGAFRLVLPQGGLVPIAAEFLPWRSGIAAEKAVEVPGPGGLAGVEVVLGGLGAISGTVSEWDGSPAAGVDLWLLEEGDTINDAVVSTISQSAFPVRPWGLRCKSGEDGSFRFAGSLEGRRYDVRRRSTADDDVVLAASVPTGTRDLAIRVERHGLAVRPTDARDGGSVHAEVWVRQGEEQHLLGRERLFAPDEDAFLAAPGTRALLWVRAPGYRDEVVERVVDAQPGLDEVPVFLRPAPPRPLVRLSCVDGRGSALPWPTASFVHEASGVRIDSVGAVREERSFETRGLEPGAWFVRTSDSGRDGGGGPGLPSGGALRWALDSEMRFEVPKEGTLERTWTLGVGGALRLTFRGGDGTVVEPGDMRCARARDDAGQVHAIRLFHRRDERAAWAEGTGQAVPYETQALPPGAYDVLWHATGDGGPVLGTARAHVRPRETTSVDLVRAVEDR